MAFICQLSFDAPDHHFDDSHRFHGDVCQNVGFQKQGRSTYVQDLPHRCPQKVDGQTSQYITTQFNWLLWKLEGS